MMFKGFNKIYNILVVVSFFACNQHSTKRPSIEHETIQGDWVSETHVVSLHDSLILTSYFGNYYGYSFNDDTLSIKSYNKNGIRKYHIEKLNKDSLVLKLLDNNVSEKRGLLSFNKLEIADNVADFEEINFTSTACEGGCPAMEVSIDKHGNIVFKGIYNVSKKGLYSYRLSKEEHEYFINKIRALSIDKLDSVYVSKIADNPIYKLNFRYNKSFKSIRTDGVEAPPALKLLITYLTNIHMIYEIQEID